MPDVQYKSMSAAPTTEQRLIDLEIKLSYSEDLLDELNKIVARQQQHIDLLLREVAALRDQVSESSPPAFRSLRDELPPHY
jgi:SlyX protein